MEFSVHVRCLNEVFGIAHSGPDVITYEVPDDEIFQVPLKGYSRHPEICKAISEGRMGMKFSEEHKLNLSLSHTGKRQPLTEETKQKISQAKKGKRRTNQEKATISEKTREKMFELNAKTYELSTPSGEIQVIHTTLSELARTLEMSKSTLTNQLAGRRKTAKGYKIRLVEG